MHEFFSDHVGLMQTRSEIYFLKFTSLTQHNKIKKFKLFGSTRIWPDQKQSWPEFVWPVPDPKIIQFVWPVPVPDQKQPVPEFNLNRNFTNSYWEFKSDLNSGSRIGSILPGQLPHERCRGSWNLQFQSCGLDPNPIMRTWSKQEKYRCLKSKNLNGIMKDTLRLIYEQKYRCLKSKNLNGIMKSKSMRKNNFLALLSLREYISNSFGSDLSKFWIASG